MKEVPYTYNMLSVLDSFALNTAGDIARQLADDFRKRRIEKEITREKMAEMSGVAISNIVRFEQKGLISLNNFISLVMTLGYTAEIRQLLATPKYSTMEELRQIRRNRGKKKVGTKRKETNEKD